MQKLIMLILAKEDGVQTYLHKISALTQTNFGEQIIFSFFQAHSK
jgi:hypothetical protein